VKFTVTFNPISMAPHTLVPGEVLDDAEAMIAGNDLCLPLIIAARNGIGKRTPFKFDRCRPSAPRK
jgi:hypothetical protein